MKLVMCAMAACCALLACQPWAHAQSAAPGDLFIVSSSDKDPDALVESLKSYADTAKWQFLGASKVKKGEVTLVKICIPEVGQQLWQLGLHVGAMLPCGNLSVYRKDGKTEVALLHPRYMELLYPDPVTKQAAATAEPLLMEMVEQALK